MMDFKSATKHQRALTARLAVVLTRIKENDQNYSVRYDLVLQALVIARMLNYSCGIKIDSSSPEWPVIFIDLPQGQVSWHMQQYQHEWDGHTTSEKYQRVDAYVRELKAQLKTIR